MPNNIPNINFNNKDNQKGEIIHEVKGNNNPSKNKMRMMVITFIVIGLGVLTGYFIFQFKGKIALSNNGGQSNNLKSKQIYGSTDKKSFKDFAEGKLEKGGLDGEGTHKLIRPGGVNQTVYLTSSVVDLNLYVGKKVKVWGETFSAQKAGWLMDVGRIEIN